MTSFAGIDHFGFAECCAQPSGKIDMPRIIDKLERHYAKNEQAEAGALLRYWRSEALSLGDERGELSVCSEQMGFYRRTGDKDAALEAVRRGLALIESLGIGKTPSAATILLNAATTRKAFGDAEGALPLFSKALDVYEKELPETDLRFAGFWNNYALALGDLKRYKEAELAFHRALIVLQQNEQDGTDEAITYVNLAQMYAKWGGRSEEETVACMDAAWELLTDEDLPENGRTAYVRASCAPAFTDFGFASRGEELRKRAEDFYARPGSVG